MRIKPGFVLKEIAGEYLAIPYGQEYAHHGSMVSLNNTGAFLWDCLGEECEKDELCRALADQFQIDSALAETAVDEFLTALRDGGLLDEA